MIALFYLVPDVGTTSSEARICSQIRVLDMLPELRIVSAAGYEDFSNHHRLRGRSRTFIEFPVQLLLKCVALMTRQQAFVLQSANNAAWTYPNRFSKFVYPFECESVLS